MQQVGQSTIDGSLADVPVKVLIVDDEAEIVEEVVDFLDIEGIECVSAHQAADALSLLRACPEIGVVVTDIRMPGMDGLEMTKLLNEEFGDERDLVVIVVTGHAGIKEAIEALQLGAEDFLTKPISPDHLLHSVRRSLELLRLRAKAREYQTQLEHDVAAQTKEIRHLVNELSDKNTMLLNSNEKIMDILGQKDQFLKMMSHELNTPLNAIIGFAQLQKDVVAERGDDAAAEELGYVYSAAMRLMEIVDAIFTLSLISSNDLNLNHGRFLASSFAHSVISERRETLIDWNGELKCEVADPRTEICADPIQLRKAVGQLVDNACKYGRNDGTVVLAIETDADWTHITVSDDGPGMTEREILTALEPMRRVNNTPSRHIDGIGAGLPLAKGIVELHGGTLDVVSKPGRGVVVKLRIPANAS